MRTKEFATTSVVSDIDAGNGSEHRVLGRDGKGNKGVILEDASLLDDVLDDELSPCTSSWNIHTRLVETANRRYKRGRTLMHCSCQENTRYTIPSSLSGTIVTASSTLMLGLHAIAQQMDHAVSLFEAGTYQAHYCGCV